MVGSIRPVVYRDKQNLRWLAAGGLHLLGSITAAALTGTALGTVGAWLEPKVGISMPLLVGALSFISITYALDELNIIQLPALNRWKQVPASWRAIFHPYVASLLYGVGLGNGILTRVVTGAVYVIVVCVMVYGTPSYGALMFALFGLGRGGSVIALGWTMRNLRTSEDLLPRLQHLIARSEWLHAIMGVALALSGGYWLAGITLPTY